MCSNYKHITSYYAVEWKLTFPASPIEVTFKYLDCQSQCCVWFHAWLGMSPPIAIMGLWHQSVVCVCVCLCKRRCGIVKMIAQAGDWACKETTSARQGAEKKRQKRGGRRYQRNHGGSIRHQSEGVRRGVSSLAYLCVFNGRPIKKGGDQLVVAVLPTYVERARPP